MESQTRLRWRREYAKMARNSEKHFVGLNRIFLEEQWKKDRERRRPHLNTLNTAADVKKWIPSIKKEMNYCVEQLSGARKHDYTDGKLKEFEDRLGYLERDYKRFVQKILQLDPSSKDVPWEARPYKRRNQQEKNCNGNINAKRKKDDPIEICPDLLEDKQHLSDRECDSKDLSPLLAQSEIPSEQKDMGENPSGLTRIEEHKTREQNGEQTKNSVQSLVSYDSSDSDDGT